MNIDWQLLLILYGSGCLAVAMICGLISENSKIDFDINNFFGWVLFWPIIIVIKAITGLIQITGGG